MLTNFFGKSKPINFIVLLLLFTAAFFLTLFQQFSMEDFTLHLIGNKVEIFVLFVVVFFFVNFIISKNNLTFDNSYALLFYILIISCFLSSFYDDKTLLVSVLNLFILRKVYAIQTLKNVFKKLFDAGVCLGIACILNPFSIVFFLLIFAAIVIHKRVRFQTVFIPIFGFLIPIFLFFTYCFWFDQTAEFTNTFLLYTKYDYTLYGESRFLIPFLIIGTLILVAIFIKTPKAFAVNNNFKKSWTLLLFHFLISLVFVLLSYVRNGSELLILAFPSAILIANGFEMFQKKLAKEILLILLLIGSILSPVLL